MILKVKGLDKLQLNLTNFGKYGNVAMSNALNKTGAIAKTQSLYAVRNGKEEWRIKASDLKKGAKPKKSTALTTTYTFEMESKSMPLMMFTGKTPYLTPLTPTGKRRSGGGGVRYKIKGKGRKLTLAKSFVRPSLFHNHREEVFTRRKSPNGAKITAQYSITPSSMFQQEGEKVFVDTFFKKFYKIYINQLSFKKIL